MFSPLAEGVPKACAASFGSSSEQAAIPLTVASGVRVVELCDDPPQPVNANEARIAARRNFVGFDICWNEVLVPCARGRVSGKAMVD